MTGSTFDGGFSCGADIVDTDDESVCTYAFVDALFDDEVEKLFSASSPSIVID